jgi:hypothetical protein
MAVDIAVPSPLVAYNNDRNLSLFREWVEQHLEHGMFVHPNVMPVIIPGFGNGVVALTDQVIKDGSIISQTPKRCILSPRNVSRPELARILASDECEDQDYTPIVKLTLAYLYECCQGENSPWHGYLTSLCVPDCPYFWEPDERELLVGTQTYAEHVQNIVISLSSTLTNAGEHD